MAILVAQDVIVRIRRGVRYPGPGVQRRVLLRERDGDRLVHLWAGADDGDFAALAIATSRRWRSLARRRRSPRSTMWQWRRGGQRV